jgi:hypothetical protein
MSKCVQIVGQGIPVRLSDGDAFQLVERDRDGEYCPKREWRKFYATDYWVKRGGRSAGYATINGPQIIRRGP